MLDYYCERCGPGLWAEPLNATSNLAFFVAALAAWRLARRLRAMTAGAATLIGLAAAVGVGSALFHTFATPWANVADLAPILAFQLAFLWLYLRHAARLGTRPAAALVATHAVTCVLMVFLPPYFNGSVLYAPTLVVLIGLATYHARTGQPGRWTLAAAAGVFCASLAFRSIDELICPSFPYGTHFLWHLLNGILLYLAMRAIILTAGADPGRTPGG
ncbi:Ceramidase [Aquisphaera giovannonii]|uniref:Ceramidase n=1 Tax=Aquisphaera giovannonii TaxID=406548 RepID=A0A5B9WDH7_9BACT|nr:ceramidase domain-containing protein [Aquisphaera giovannonii]QEH38115.1 Ceramidase [Aquisphaera giovannonii]